jgi:hypothetical protein
VKDVAERVVKTYVEAFVGLLLASNVFDVNGVVHLDLAQQAAVAAIPAVLSVILSLVSKPVGSDNDSASIV